MARIELRDCTIRIKDGLSGTALITEGANASAVLDSNAVNSDLTFTADNEGTGYNNWDFEIVADANAGAYAIAELDSNAANSDVTMTSPTKDDVYNAVTNFAVAANAAESVDYDVNTDTFTIYLDTANAANANNLKVLFDAAITANPTWPQWTCAVDGDGTGAVDAGVWDVAAGGLDEVLEEVIFAANAFTIHVSDVSATANEVVALWAAGPAECADWTIADEGNGSGAVDEVTDTSAGGLAEPGANDTDVNISTISLNTVDTDLVPVGARFTPSTAGHTTVHVVTARTPSGTSPTTNIVFSPAWGSVTPIKGDTLNFAPQQIDIKIGDGNLTYTEAKEYEYLLERGVLDAVKEGDEQPLEVSLEFVYEHVTTGTSEAISPVDALKNKGGAIEWVTSGTDPCEPYCVDMEIEQEAPCGTIQDETTLLPEFRYDSLEFNLQDATIAVAGKCNATEATITRG